MEKLKEVVPRQVNVDITLTLITLTLITLTLITLTLITLTPITLTLITLMTPVILIILDKLDTIVVAFFAVTKIYAITQ